MDAKLWKSEAGRSQVLDAYRRLLNEWPLPHREINIETRLGKTFIVAFGQDRQGVGDPCDEPILLLHGSASNSAVWMGDATGFCHRRQVYAIDVPGEPGFSQEVRPSLAGPEYIDWLSDVCDGLGVSKVALLGMSLGGFLAMRFASTHPDRVSSMALICPSGLAPVRWSFMIKCLVLAPMGQKGILRIVLGGIHLPSQADQFMALIARHFRPRIETVPVLTDNELGHLTMPITYVAGDEDALLSTPRSATRLRQLVPHAQIVTLPGVGHVITDIAEKIDGFMASG